MLALEVIEPAQTEWAAPIVSAPKQDGTVRFCVYYRKLHAVKKRHFHSITRMDVCIYFFDESAIISTLEAKSEYWEIEI